MTIAQIWIYLTEDPGPAGRRRMSAADARALCNRKRSRRERWIRRMMERLNHAK